jgi:paired amphipathic helix protein Sin3a
MLFHGHSELIGGFNTFLPPGYRIEISSDPRQDVITVTTPMGVLTQMSDGSIGRLPQNPPSLQPPPAAVPSPAPLSNLQSLSVNASNLRPITPQSVTPARIPPPQQQHPPPPFRDMSPPPNAIGAPPYSPSGLRAPAQTPNDAAVSILGNMSGRADTFRIVGGPGQAGEFNHAIQYLTRIKLRYSDDQATYKTFLEILQAYQKERSHFNDVRLVSIALLASIR